MADNHTTPEDKREKLARGLGLLSVPVAITSAIGGSLLDATAADAASLANQESKSQAAKPSSGSLQNAVPNKSSREHSPASALPSELATQVPDLYTVRAGDSIDKISTKFQLPASLIRSLNDLGTGKLLFPGQVLKLNSASVLTKGQQQSTETKKHTVASGETLLSIANHYKISLDKILAINSLKPSTIIYPGQVLTIGSVLAQPQRANGTKPTVHRVSAGETLSQIARRHGIALATLMKLNRLNEQSIIFAGQTLKLSTRVASSVVAPCELHGTHRVKAGETISKIAAAYGTSTQAVLSANKLSWSSPIYVGQKIYLPQVHSAVECPDFIALDDEQFANAQVIYEVAQQQHLPDRAVLVALVAAAQESGLRNIKHGDLDSLGLFQQRPSSGWGSAQQVTDPVYASKAFFGGPKSGAHGRAVGLLDIKGWQTMPIAKAAQAVQGSAFPDRYAKWQPSASVWLQQLKNGDNNA